MSDVTKIRDCVLNLYEQAGKMCTLLLGVADDSPYLAIGAIEPGIGHHTNKMMCILLEVSTLCRISLVECILSKIKINKLKYPPNLVMGKIQKYTEYSRTTGITRQQGQSITRKTSGFRSSVNEPGVFVEHVSAVCDMACQFVVERDWVRYDKPRNLLLAMLTEVGELGELYQWKQGDDTFSTKLLDKTGQELADVAIYLLRFGRVCGIEMVMGKK